MATIDEIRIGIEAQLLTLDTLRVAQEWGDPINVSGNASVAVVEYAGATYDDAFSGQGDALLFGIIALASKASDRAGRRKLDLLCDPEPTSTTSIRHAVNGNLNGIVASAVVTTSSGYQEYSPGEEAYLGVEFVVRVMT